MTCIDHAFSHNTELSKVLFLEPTNTVCDVHLDSHLWRETTVVTSNHSIKTNKTHISSLEFLRRYLCPPCRAKLATISARLILYSRLRSIIQISSSDFLSLYAAKVKSSAWASHRIIEPGSAKWSSARAKFFTSEPVWNWPDPWVAAEEPVAPWFADRRGLLA